MSSSQYKQIIIALVISVTAIPASGQDTLLNVVQWPVSSGGNDHWYGIVSLVMPWVDHRDLASSFELGIDTGYLATITSQAENDFVMSVIQNHINQPSITDEFYLGGNRIGEAWKWLTNEQMLYINWSSGEPSGDGNALAIWGASQNDRAGL